MERCKVAPSILSADFSHLEEEINKIESLGAEYLHFDVMDGHFVDNISFGLPVLKSIAHIHHMILLKITELLENIIQQQIH